MSALFPLWPPVQSLSLRSASDASIFKEQARNLSGLHKLDITTFQWEYKQTTRTKLNGRWRSAVLPFNRSWHILAEIMWSLFKEFLRFCKQEKKWWLIPLIVLLLVLGAILLFTASSGIAWALYPFM